MKIGNSSAGTATARCAAKGQRAQYEPASNAAATSVDSAYTLSPTARAPSQSQNRYGSRMKLGEVAHERN